MQKIIKWENCIHWIYANLYKSLIHISHETTSHLATQNKIKLPVLLIINKIKLLRYTWNFESLGRQPDHRNVLQVSLIFKSILAQNYLCNYFVT